jgi:hypothetical protein
LLPNLDETITMLANLVLGEQISRYSQVKNKVHKLDSFETLVSVVDGVEQYSEVRRNNKVYSHVGQIDGIWSFGEIVTMLRTTRDALNGRTEPDAGETELDLLYSYTAGSRRWFVMVGARIYWLDFEGSVRLVLPTRDIRRITWTSSSLPPETGITRITWTVDFQSVEIAGRVCTVPRTAVFRIARNGSGNRADCNVTQFSEQGRYGSESSLRFEPSK